MATPRVDRIAIAQTQAAISIALLTLLVAVCASLSIAARLPSLRDYLNREETDDSLRSGRWNQSVREYFFNHGERVVLEEIENADCTKGGVYLIGTSTGASASGFWRLPSAERDLIHNYSFFAASNEMQYQLLRHLIERRNLLEAGGDKTLVILATTYHAVISEYDTKRFFADAWERRGLYIVKKGEEIEAVPLGTAERFLRIERTRLSGFVRRWSSWAFNTLAGRRQVHFTKQTAEEYIDLYTKRYGATWESRLVRQVAAFDDMLAYLKQRDIRILVILLPLGSPDDQMAFQARYNDEFAQLCAVRQVSILDWSHRLSDDDFGGGYHMNITGMEKLQPDLLRIAYEHLRSTGALP